MRKGYLITLLGIFLVALLAVNVSAAPSITETFSSSNPTFGGPTQDASNPREDNDRYDNIVLTVNNDLANNINITGTSKTLIGVFATPGINITEVTTLPVTVTAGGSNTLELKARIPQELDAISSTNMQEVAIKVADLTLSYVDTTGVTGTISVPVYMQRENKLDLDGTIFVNGGDEGDIDDDVKDVKPGSEFSVEFIIENTYNDNEDIDLEDVEFELEGDSELDADTTESVDDISAEDQETGDVDFTLDQDVDDGTYDLRVMARAVDEYGAFHGVFYDIEIDVERETHDVVVEKLSLTPKIVQCEDSVEVVIDTLNIGKKDEEDVYVTIENSELKLSEESDRFDIDRDDDRTFRVSFVVPFDAEEKDYTIMAEVLGDNVFSDNTDSATLTVEGNCFVEVKEEVVSIGSAEISAIPGETASVELQILNTGNTESDYTIELTGTEGWAGLVLPQTFTLGPGEGSSIAIDVVPKNDLEEGTYTAVLNVKRGSDLVKTQQINVNYEKPKSIIRDVFGGSVTWIIIDIILILLVIGVIVKIVMSRKKKREA